VPRRPAAKRTTDAGGATTVRGKRANGAGSVYFDQSNECYFATWRDGDGRRRKVRGKTQAEAERRRADAVERDANEPRRAGSRFSAATTVHELAVWWLDNVAPHRMRPSSVGTVAKRLTRERLRRLADVAVVDLTSEQVQEWQSGLLRGAHALSPSTVADTRVTLNHVLDLAVDHQLVSVNPGKRVKPPRIPKTQGRHLHPADAQRLVAACSGARYGAAVAMLFMQGWRVSEVLGLAWGDLDLDATEPTATVRRAVVQVPGTGRVLGPPKTEGAEGVHYLLPGVVDRLRAHRAAQAVERLAAGPLWQSHRYDGARVDLVFTTVDGGIVARQHVDKLIRAKAEALGIDTAGLGTHVGRRTVVTAMSEDGVALDDIARHVGHRSATTTAGYVRSHKERDRATAKRAATLLDVPALGTPVR
jgi:integrase